jgi:hypothetical protein
MRWLLLPLALGVAMTALYALLTGPVRLESGANPGAVSTGGSAAAEIREPSRQRLREILREEERKDRR